MHFKMTYRNYKNHIKIMRVYCFLTISFVFISCTEPTIIYSANENPVKTIKRVERSILDSEKNFMMFQCDNLR